MLWKITLFTKTIKEKKVSIKWQMAKNNLKEEIKR